MAKAKVKTLYENGDFDRAKPGTLEVKLLKWTTAGIDDVYVLELRVVGDDCRQFSNLFEHGQSTVCKTSLSRLLVEVDCDGDAIATAVHHYESLRDGIAPDGQDLNYLREIVVGAGKFVAVGACTGKGEITPMSTDGEPPVLYPGDLVYRFEGNK